MHLLALKWQRLMLRGVCADWRRNAHALRAVRADECRDERQRFERLRIAGKAWRKRGTAHAFSVWRTHVQAEKLSRFSERRVVTPASPILPPPPAALGLCACARA